MKAFAAEMECQIELMCPEESTRVLGEGGRTIRVLHLISGDQGGHPDHYLPVWPRHQGDEGEIPTLGVRSTHGIRAGNQTRARPGEKTEVITVNVSGSKEQLRAVLGMKVDIVLVQEHWAHGHKLGSWKSMAAAEGWHGVWTNAEVKATSASGGVAILCRRARPIFPIEATQEPRLGGAVVSWTRRTKLHLYSIYGYDSGKQNCDIHNRALHRRFGEEVCRIGRVPWIAGGDWNVEPDSINLGHYRGVNIRTLGEPTTDSGSNLDWFLTKISESNEDKYQEIQRRLSIEETVDSNPSRSNGHAVRELHCLQPVLWY